MKKWLSPMLSLLLLGCRFHSGQEQMKENIAMRPVQQNLNCDSLIESLVRKNRNKILDWYEIKITERKQDSIKIRVFATFPSKDTFTVMQLVLLQDRAELIDVMLDPILRYYEVDPQTLQLINVNCHYPK